MAGSNRPKGVPKDAILFVGQPLPPDFDRQHQIEIGDWIIDGVPYAAARFAPAPIADVAPPVASLPPEPEPAPPITPTIHRIVPIEDPPPPLSIAPSALDVDQGSMSHN